MKKAITLLVLVFALSASAYATNLSIQAITTIPWNDRRTVGLELWVFANQAWVDIDGTPHGPGTPQNRVFTQRVSGLTNNTTTHKLTIPAFSLTPTLNAIRGSSVRLNFWIVQVIGENVIPIKQIPATENGLRVPATILSATIVDGLHLSATWADLIVYNTPSPALPRETYPTFSDVARLIITALGSAQGPAGVQGQLQVNAGGIFGVLPGSTSDGADLALTGGSLLLSLPSGSVFQAGPASQQFTFDPHTIDVVGAGASGSAPLILRPTFHFTNSTNFRATGIFVAPVIGSLAGATGASQLFLTPYNFKMGTSASPIPAGTNAVISGYEGSIFSAQAAADVPEGGKVLGATITLTGGAPFNGTAITMIQNTVGGNLLGHNLNITKNVAGGTQFGFYANSTGTQNATAAFAVEAGSSGKFDYGVLLNGHAISKATNVSFAEPDGNMTDYSFDGSLTSTFIFTGGGSAGGMILYGNNATGENGDFRFRDNPIQNNEKIILNTQFGYVQPGTVTFATLSGITGAANGAYIYCSDCTASGAGLVLCSGSGAGAMAHRRQASWVCH